MSALGDCPHEERANMRLSLAIQTGHWPTWRYVPDGWRESGRLSCWRRVPKRVAAWATIYLAVLFLMAAFLPDVPYGWLLAGAAVIWLLLVAAYLAVLGWYVEVAGELCDCDMDDD